MHLCVIHYLSSSFIAIDTGVLDSNLGSDATFWITESYYWFIVYLCVLLLSLTKEQSLWEAGHSEKWGQGHSEAQVRQQIYHSGKHWAAVCCKTQIHRLWCSVFIRWFEGFNWDGLCKRTLNPPVIPRVRHFEFSITLILIQGWFYFVMTQWEVFYIFFLLHCLSGEASIGRQHMWSLHCGLSGAVHKLGRFLMLSAVSSWGKKPVRPYFIAFRFSPHK